MKTLRTTLMSLVALVFMVPAVSAATDTYIVQRGDSLWKIAVKYKIGLSEIIAANSQLQANPDLIYPMQKVTIPLAPPAQRKLEAEVLALVNAERAKAGLSPLVLDWQLCRVAKAKSDDMANQNYFSHQSPTYGSPFQMMKQFGISYKSAGENIAAGQRSAAEVMNSWMNSPGHRANILSNTFTNLGVGQSPGGSGGPYWTQQFIGK